MSEPRQPKERRSDPDDRAPDRDLPGLLDDMPPSGDLTPDDEATRAAGPGLRHEPEGGPYVVDADGAVVDAGSPQDYGDPNANVAELNEDGEDDAGRR